MIMHDINVQQTEDIIYDSIFEATPSPRKQSSVLKRRHIRARLDELTEERELRRLIENEWEL